MKQAVYLILIIVGAFALGLFFASGRKEPVAPSGRPTAGLSDRGAAARPSVTSGAERVARDDKSRLEPVVAADPSGSGEQPAVEPVAVSQPARTSAERAVAAWEAAVDALVEVRPDADLAARGRQLHEQFSALETEQDKIDGTRRLMNLMPDEAVPAVYPILFDLTQPEEVLGTIFSDILNRPETVKQPVIDAVAQEVRHPMFTDAAHIKEVTRSLPPPADSEE